jgi:hypothetical protein
MVCKGLLKYSAMPHGVGEFGHAVIDDRGQRFSRGWTEGAAFAREISSGTNASEV